MAHRIIFVSQEIAPYIDATDNAQAGRTFPQALQRRKYEVRTFMPDFGDVNERRNQLHEVIRLSGMNISISDADHPLLVKVASMHPSRIQVYFIDNDDYFQKLDTDEDSFGINRPDNDERMIFYARGTVDTAKKLRWEPDVIHISGWMSSLVPMYVRELYGQSFPGSKLVFCVQPSEEGPAEVNPAIFGKLLEEGVPSEAVDRLRALPADELLLRRIAVGYSDGVVFRGVDPDPALVELCREKEIPYISLAADEENVGEILDNFYQSL